jgi:hypothetical protein
MSDWNGKLDPFDKDRPDYGGRDPIAFSRTNTLLSRRTAIESER